MNKNLEITKVLRFKNKISINKNIIKFINSPLKTINKLKILVFNTLNFIKIQMLKIKQFVLDI